ncbi:type I glutamate--ammonia ligase [Synechococcus sp. CS-1328]|uniref:type I glutamate--ammonia ligase n=1 Tax=Synechococcus sp. CS-1328 TaxID=2847976 RepID=UPI00223A8CF6|nr:type I glutamate--ammonia ligase [Synechococcus sp. CS-1328]MCT0226261.1 type I glutamate--ammonia ligase [Synechococcus sp. CS-1328]
MAQTTRDVLSLIKDEGIELIDLKVADLHGRWQHLTVCADQVNARAFADGLAFDSSSLRGWNPLQDSEIALVPDPGTAWIDPFHSHRTLSLICSIQERRSGKPTGCCPRSLAQRAFAYLGSTGLADTAYFGPQPEFFLFDDGRDSSSEASCYSNKSSEAAWNNGDGMHGKQGPWRAPWNDPVAAHDTDQDMRSELVLLLGSLGVPIERHHQAVTASGQQRLAMTDTELIRAADNLMTTRYVVRNLARKYGRSATFMPQPVHGANGSGLPVHQSLWKAGQPLFFGEGTYANLSQTARWYIGGLLRHAPSFLAFTNPGTNSYRRLVSGIAAPVNLIYSQANRSAAVRIPITGPSPRAKRLEFRSGDGLANPYLALSAMLMAGLDGIRNQIDPGEGIDGDLIGLPADQLARIATVPASLSRTLEALNADKDYLLAGGVFSEDLIANWIALKDAEVQQLRQRPHPYEYSLYYDA